MGKIQVDSGKVAWIEAGFGNEKAPCKGFARGFDWALKLALKVILD